MQVGKVVGSIVSTQKHESLKGMKLMMVDILDGEQELTGRIEIAVDTVCAGEGDCVHRYLTWSLHQQCNLYGGS